MNDVIYTVGHSTHPIERLLELLKIHSVTALCDVRSRPYSRMNPQFNREILKESLRQAGIKYVFLGKELGGRSENRSCYRDGRVDYELLAQTDLFKYGIERVKIGAQDYRLALMCAEKEPLECHRTILISRRLFERGLYVKHILDDGGIEDHENTMERLIARLGIVKAQGDMFRSNDAICEAYIQQGHEIAYREDAPDDPFPDCQPHERVSGRVR